MNRKKQRLNQTRPPPSETPLVSEGREALGKAGACRKASGLPRLPSPNGGQLNMGMEEATQASNTSDWDNGGVTYQAGPLQSVKGAWNRSGQVEDPASQRPRVAGHHC